MNKDAAESKKEKVIKYLNKTYSELVDEQSLVQKHVDTHEAKVKEMYKAIQIAEQEIDPNYNLFSPKTSGKIKMNNTLSDEYHLLENELEELKYKNKRLKEKIGTTKDIIECIIGGSPDEIFEDNSIFLDSLIEDNNDLDNNIDSSIDKKTDEDNKNNNKDNNKDNNNYTDVKNENSVSENDEESDDDFEIVKDEIEEEKEYVFDDKLRMKFLNIQENEKNRIARDLHDTTVQNLTSLIHKSELCLKLVDVDPIRTKLELQAMKNLLKESVGELRNIIYGLKPMSLDDFGLNVTVKKFVNQLNLADGPKFRFITEGYEKSDMDSVITLTLFRIIQEACNNAIKHSMANNVDILIDYMDDCINVIIMDDGIGYKSDDESGNEEKDFSSIGDGDSISGFGMSIMRERTYLLSGSFMIDYANVEEKKGTKIVVVIPLSV